MKKFAVQHPKTRGYMNEWYLHKLLHYINTIYLRYDFNKKSVLFKNQKTIKEILSTYILPEIKDGSIIEQKDKKFMSTINKNKLPIEFLSVSINGTEITNSCYLYKQTSLTNYQNIKQLKSKMN